MKTAVLAAVISAITVPALANPGVEMLARTLGVSPGEYTAAEMMAIAEARREEDDHVEKFFISKSNRKQAAPAEVVTPGEAQLAASLGLDPAKYTLSELSQLYIEAITSDNH